MLLNPPVFRSCTDIETPIVIDSTVPLLSIFWPVTTPLDYYSRKACAAYYSASVRAATPSKLRARAPSPFYAYVGSEAITRDGLSFYVTTTSRPFRPSRLLASSIRIGFRNSK